MRTISRVQSRECQSSPGLVVVAVWLVGLASTSTAFGQFGHSDVDLGLDGQKLMTNKRVYDSFFPTFGISKQFTSNPGFAAETDGMGAIVPGVNLVYDVLDDLLLWDGTQFVEPGDEVRIRIDNNPPGSSSTIVTSTSGEQLGSSDPPVNRISASSPRGEVHAHVNFFLEGGEETPPLGAYGLKIKLATDSNEIVGSDPMFIVFNFGLGEPQFDESLDLYEALLDSSEVLGDFNQNGALDVDDIDRLTDAILRNDNASRFDLNADGLVDQEDRREWVKVLRATSFGDSDLDGDFDSSDLVIVFAAGKYESGSFAQWLEGDWDGDGLFGTSDLVMAFRDGGYEQPSATAVPEPHGILLLGIAVVTTLGCVRNRFRRE